MYTKELLHKYSDYNLLLIRLFKNGHLDNTDVNCVENLTNRYRIRAYELEKDIFSEEYVGGRLAQVVI